MNKAEKNKADKFKIQMPNKIIPVMAGEELKEEKMAAGAECITVDISPRRIAENAAKRKER